MNLSEYTYLLNNPNAVNEKQAKALETVVDNFPFFQSARALYLKGLYNQDSYKYNFALKQTAAHTTDRSVLFDFITSDEFTIIEKDIYEQKLAQLMGIEVVESNIGYAIFTETNNVIEIQDFEESTLPTIEFEPIADIEFVKVEELETNVNDSELEEKIIPVEIVNEVISVDITKDKQIAEEKLQLGKPISFTQNEQHSFQEWLQLASINPIERKTEVTKPLFSAKPIEKEDQKAENISDKQKKLEIIDKFIETNPKITPSREVVETPVKSIEISDTTHLMTETLARVYLEQKKFSKAIQAYEILILKYPEKSIFFADRIKDIKILQQNNQ
ncbi:tetratricopeptide repeat protein [Flavobacterium sp.]|uniref:tetratricopeptide repeat protein n=1 Tax=Flavobacterium sp. TaxID=239 RepID=UPI0037BFD707